MLRKKAACSFRLNTIVVFRKYMGIVNFNLKQFEKQPITKIIIVTYGCSYLVSLYFSYSSNSSYSC